MKKKLLFLILFLKVITICSSETNIIIKPSNNEPTWAKEYHEEMKNPIKVTSDGMFKEIINSKYKNKIYMEKSGDKYHLLYQKNKSIQRLLTSEEGFLHPQWSKDKMFFTIVSLTYVGDISNNGNIYVYKFNGNKLVLIYHEKDMGATPGFFSNSSKHFIYWSSTTSHNGLLLLDLNTKKKSIIELPLEYGAATTMAWRKDDKAIHMTYVVDHDGKDYTLYNIDKYFIQ
jgi:Tol biopolymer transport system component